MTDSTVPTSETMVVYRDGVGVNHLPATDPAMTKCGFDTEWMERRDHPISHAARWCHLCFKAVMEKDA